ncbi:hypothetical protein OEM_13140 [Mycobacterium intracellulare subsp. yongonense 05-1390]|nr:hypothetical protein OEM_13140 [Mycobacterium intracellulare subsp. yongonense 05-1390]
MVATVSYRATDLLGRCCIDRRHVDRLRFRRFHSRKDTAGKDF